MIWSHRQEDFSRAYVQAIVAQAGMIVGTAAQDYGIDLSIKLLARRANRVMDSGYRLDVQLKSTSSFSADNEHVLYDLEVRNYDDLRITVTATPRILVVLLVPEAVTEWTEQTEQQLSLRRCAYWLSLRGWPATANTSTVRLRIPRTQMFSVSALHKLAEQVQNQEPL